jgi:dolichol-phosphate mannosyltransferase
MKIIVLIPIYKVKFSRLKKIIFYLKSRVFKIVCIDDCCPFNTGKKITRYQIKNLNLIYNKKNLGVGGAMKEGFKYIKKLKFDYAVKIDGDGQLNAKQAIEICKYSYNKKLDYTVGTRFQIKRNKINMPKSRWYGNKIISLLSKVSSGQYQIEDFLNGMICISKKSLIRIDLEKIKNSFLFETSMIFENSIKKHKITNFPINVKYFKEGSNFKPTNEVLKFIIFNIQNFVKRIYLNYFSKKIEVISILILINTFFIIYFVHFFLSNFKTKSTLILLFVNIFLFCLIIVLDYINNKNHLRKYK